MPPDDLPIGLGKPAGMKFKSNLSLLEVLRSRLSVVNHVTYHFSLPNNDIKVLSFIVKEINMQVNRYYEKYNKRPTMVIDAIDWLSKQIMNFQGIKKQIMNFQGINLTNEASCEYSVLSMLLVSMEEHVLPMLDKQSHHIQKCFML